jgi:hypothetical protein
MSDLLVEIDGQHIPLRRCVWVFYAPCGCPRGVINAMYGDTVLHDEDTAWRGMFNEGNKRESTALVKHERAAGVTSELMPFDRYRAEVNPLLVGKCPHARAAEAEAAGQVPLFDEAVSA